MDSQTTFTGRALVSPSKISMRHNLVDPLFDFPSVLKSAEFRRAERDFHPPLAHCMMYLSAVAYLPPQSTHSILSKELEWFEDVRPFFVRETQHWFFIAEFEDTLVISFKGSDPRSKTNFATNFLIRQRALPCTLSPQIKVHEGYLKAYCGVFECMFADITRRFEGKRGVVFRHQHRPRPHPRKCCRTCTHPHQVYCVPFSDALRDLRGVEIPVLGPSLDLPFKRVIFTGHSAGGALASIAATHFGQYVKEMGCKDKLRVMSYIFGSPAIGNSKFRELHDNCVDVAYNVRNHSDIVPHMPPLNWGYHSVGIVVKASYRYPHVFEVRYPSGTVYLGFDERTRCDKLVHPDDITRKKKCVYEILSSKKFRKPEKFFRSLPPRRFVSAHRHYLGVRLPWPISSYAYEYEYLGMSSFIHPKFRLLLGEEKRSTLDQ